MCIKNKQTKNNVLVQEFSELQASQNDAGELVKGSRAHHAELLIQQACGGLPKPAFWFIFVSILHCIGFTCTVI